MNIFHAIVYKFNKTAQAEMCLWDNLGNSTDLHWEASIGQVGNIWETMFLVSLKNAPVICNWPDTKYMIIPSFGQASNILLFLWFH